jgi:hypothetical protein
VVTKFLSFLRRPFSNTTLEKKVDQELSFHIEMQAVDFQRKGLSPEESQSQAQLRFGDVSKVRKQCIRIGTQRTLLFSFLKIVFTLAFIAGVVIRIVTPELHVTRVGDVLMMIGGLGGLLLYLKSIGSNVLKNDEDPLSLGLNLRRDVPPVPFDEEGRTPFDRVRTD